VSVVEVLVELGGVATRAVLLEATSRSEVDRALRDGEIVGLRRGRYAVSAVDEGATAAHRAAGVLSGPTAALHHGWAVATVPDRPEVTVPRHRRLAERPEDVTLRWIDLGRDDIDGVATSKDRTLLDCLRREPVDAALAVADSALRDGFSRARLLAIARDARGPGSPQVRLVAALADGRSANPFESVLRGIASRVDGLDVVPQVSIRDPHFLGRPDLVDQRLRIILEADSFAWHGDRAALDRDAHRYNEFVAAGWLVLRFSWEDVMLRPGNVLAVLRAVVQRRTEVRCAGCHAA
jgi:very-short-patch-repair endonuclease